MSPSPLLTTIHVAGTILITATLETAIAAASPTAARAYIARSPPTPNVPLTAPSSVDLSVLDQFLDNGHGPNPNSDFDSDSGSETEAPSDLLDGPLLRLSQDTDWEGGPDSPTTKGARVGLGILSQFEDKEELHVPTTLPMPSTSPRIQPSRWNAGLRRRVTPQPKPVEKHTPAKPLPRSTLWWLLFPLFLVLGSLLFMTRTQDVAWRLDCASQNTFPSSVAEKSPEVNLVIAVLSTATRKGMERRMAIRQTWAAHPGRVAVKFLLPPSVEAETERAVFNDVALLSSPSQILQWAQTEATVPVQQGEMTRWQVADFLVKTTDDTFLLPHEIEKRLRLLPRTRTVWGAPTPRGVDQDTWAVSSDLFSSTSKGVNELLQRGEASVHGEKCGVYDHPLSRTSRAHGFLTASDMLHIKSEVRYGLPSSEIAARGGGTRHLSYSSVVNQMRRSRPLQRKARKNFASPDPLKRVAGLMEGATPTIGGGGNFTSLLPSSSTGSKCPVAGCHMPLVGTRGPSQHNGGGTLAVRRVGGEWFLTSLALLGEAWREGSEMRMI